MTDFFTLEAPFINVSTDIIEQLETVISKGGIMMVPLGICSFIVLMVTLERFLVLRKNRLVSIKYYADWNQWLSSNKQDKHLPKHKKASILNSILFSLVGVLPLSQSRLDERIADLARKEKHQLERGLVFLDTIAGIAPLFGLLGTALGMVEVFSRLSTAGEAKMSALSSGISQALFTTVAGLCIGIPSLIAFNLLSRHIERILIIAEEQLNALIDNNYSKIVKE